MVTAVVSVWWFPSGGFRVSVDVFAPTVARQ